VTVHQTLISVNNRLKVLACMQDHDRFPARGF